MALRRALPPNLQFQRHVRQQITRECLVAAQPGSKRPDAVAAGRSQSERSDLRSRYSFGGRVSWVLGEVQPHLDAL